VAISKKVGAFDPASRSEPQYLSVHGRIATRPLPLFFVRDATESCLGLGDAAFAAATSAFRQWAMFDLGWIRVANPSAVIALSQIVAVEAQSLGLWSLNLSTIVDTIDASNQFGFVYATTPDHVEEGEERFLVEISPDTGQVTYKLEAVSRPRDVMARLGLPITRAFQRKFAIDSHKRMHQAIHRQAG